MLTVKISKLIKLKHFSKKHKTKAGYNTVIKRKNTAENGGTEIIMNKNDQEFLIQKIRTQYTEKEHTVLDELKKLDNDVKRPANVFAYVFGSVGAIVMGSGMSLIMTDIAEQLGFGGNVTPAGVAIGVVGMVMAIVNYPIYKSVLGVRRKKYASKIIELSEKIMIK